MTKDNRRACALAAALAMVGCAVASPSCAQGVAPTSAAERVLGQRLLQEINSGLQCGTGLLTAQDELARLQKELAELKSAKTPVSPK